MQQPNPTHPAIPFCRSHSLAARRSLLLPPRPMRQLRPSFPPSTNPTSAWEDEGDNEDEVKPPRVRAVLLTEPVPANPSMLRREITNRPARKQSASHRQGGRERIALAAGWPDVQNVGSDREGGRRMARGGQRSSGPPPTQLKLAFVVDAETEIAGQSATISSGAPSVQSVVGVRMYRQPFCEAAHAYVPRIDRLVFLSALSTLIAMLHGDVHPSIAVLGTHIYCPRF